MKGGVAFEHVIPQFDAFGPLDLDVSFVWDRVQEPRPESSGLVPKKDDYRLIFGFGFDF